MSHVMRKPVYAICKQQRHRSVSVSKISSPYLTSVAVQAGLSLPWSQIPKAGFLMTWLICKIEVCF